MLPSAASLLCIQRLFGLPWARLSCGGSTNPPLFITSISSGVKVLRAYFLLTWVLVCVWFERFIAGLGADKKDVQIFCDESAVPLLVCELSLPDLWFKKLSTSPLSSVWCGPEDTIWFGSSLYWFMRFLTLGPIAWDFLSAWVNLLLEAIIDDFEIFFLILFRFLLSPSNWRARGRSVRHVQVQTSLFSEGLSWKWREVNEI